MTGAPKPIQPAALICLDKMRGSGLTVEGRPAMPPIRHVATEACARAFVNRSNAARRDAEPVEGSLNRRIRTDIERRIFSGDWRPGHRLPIEHDLMRRSEEHTSELQALMRSSYAGFCLKKERKFKYYNYEN